MSADYKTIAAAALAPGLRHAVEISLAALNDAREALGLPPVRIEEGAPPKKRGRPPRSVAASALAAPPPSVAKRVNGATS